MSSVFDIITIGGAARDIIFYTDAGFLISNLHDLTHEKLLGFEYGAKIASNRVFFGSGGGGTNTAVCFARLGLAVFPWLQIGRDQEGDELLENLKAEGVHLGGIHRDDQKKTGFSFIVIDAKTKEHVVFFYRGANDHLRLSRSNARNFSTQWIYLSSLTAIDWKDTLRVLYRIVDEKKIGLAWNPGSTQLKVGKKGLLKLLEVTDVFILNHDEAIELVLTSDERPKKIKDPRVLIQVLQRWGPRLVVVTKGKEGVFVGDGKNIHFLRAPKVSVVDTTGAGDCFGSSFVAGLIKFDGDVKRAMKLGVLNTTSLVQVIGAQGGLLRWSEVQKKIS